MIRRQVSVSRTAPGVCVMVWGLSWGERSKRAEEESAENHLDSGFHFNWKSQRSASFLQLRSGWNDAVCRWSSRQSFYSGQLPFDDPWPLQASQQPLWSSEHQKGRKKKRKLIAKVIILSNLCDDKTKQLKFRNTKTCIWIKNVFLLTSCN